MVATIKALVPKCKDRPCAQPTATHRVFDKDGKFVGQYCRPHAVNAARRLDDEEFKEQIMKTELNSLFSFALPLPAET